MKKQINPNIQAYLLRVAFYVLMVVAMCAIPFALAQRNVTKPEAATELSQRTLTFAERVAYQRAIEDVYWRHRIWPKENPEPKPSLDAVMSQAQLEKKVEDYVRKSQALEDYWQRPITAEQLQAEMERMAQQTKQPEVLRELFEALGNDPFVIAECLARPTLAERLESEFYARDRRFQGELREHEEANLQVEIQVPKLMAAASPSYSLPTIPDGLNGCIDDTWTATSRINAPTAREFHTAVWTGSEMIVWGGFGGNFPGQYFNSGGRYNPSTNSWTATSTTNAPSARYGHTAVWTGSEMIVWGGYRGGPTGPTGGRYNPGTDSWVATSTTNAPRARQSHTAVWTGSEMIVWGGYGGQFLLNTGGRYNPSTDTWTATSAANAPDGRYDHTVVWTGTEMMVWGGVTGINPLVATNTGGRYNPGMDSWVATSTTNAPDARTLHSAVSTGTEMMVWGGEGPGPLFHFFNTGGRYNPRTDRWTAISTANAPIARALHAAVWTGIEMIVWGGFRGGYVNTGGRYDPDTNSWTATSTTNAPPARQRHTAVWTGREMIVWGGVHGSTLLNTGWRYCAPPLTIIQPNGGDVWVAGSVHQIKWDHTNLRHSDRLTIWYSRNGGATWFRIAQDIQAFAFGYWWQVDNYPTTQGRVKIVLQENRSITDESDANFTVRVP